jgi:DNA-binding transcriptional LysR family regulator
MLTEQKIHGFIVLATELNYTKAAERLHITQQTLSKQISFPRARISEWLEEKK